MRAHMKVFTYFQKLTVSKSVNFSVWDIRPKIGVESSILVIMVFTTMASQIIFTVEFFFHTPSNPAGYQQTPLIQTGFDGNMFVSIAKHVCASCHQTPFSSTHSFTFCKRGRHTSPRDCRPHIDCCFRPSSVAH